jgi:hypothetical protein
MYLNGILLYVETIPGIREGGVENSGEGVSKYDISDIF